MLRVLDRFRERADDCRCETRFDGDRLVVDASDCPGGGRLADEPACRETAVAALADRDAETVVSRADGVGRAYEDDAAALLTAAGRFVERVAVHDERLAATARRDPLAAGRQATGRAPPVSTIAAETGLALLVDRHDDYRTALRPYTGPTVAKSRVAATPPAGATLLATSETETDATVRRYDHPDRAVSTYHLEPVEATLDADATATLDAAAERLASGAVAGGERAPGRAVRAVADADDPVPTLTAVLRKHTRGFGVVADLLADPAVSDVFATAPVSENPLRVVADGETMRTNVRLTDRGAETLASRFRRASGRSFSRAAPTLDAAGETATGTVRVAGVTDPVSDGVAFAFRERNREAWTLPALVANGTLPARAAALLSLAVERGAAVLVAGARGAGKTTLLGALLPELPAATRTVCIEDTPELPVETLQDAGRDVQALRTSVDDGPGLAPAAALRTALRLGRGVLVVGEVRGDEAQVLYEAMRVGASDGAVLGTVHGDGGASVRERVVSDLGVARSAFAATDVVVTVERTAEGRNGNRRLRGIEEVVSTGDETGESDRQTRFESLWTVGGDGPEPTGRIARGASHLLGALATAGESYAGVRERLDVRTDALADLAADGRTDLDALRRAYTSREVNGC